MQIVRLHVAGDGGVVVVIMLGLRVVSSQAGYARSMLLEDKKNGVPSIVISYLFGLGPGESICGFPGNKDHAYRISGQSRSARQ